MRHHRSLVLLLAGSSTVLLAQDARPLSPQDRREIIRQHLDRDDDPRHPVGPQGRPITDRADLRRDAMKQWWGEWTPEFRLFLLDSARGEKLRYSHLMPKDPSGKEMALAASATGTWLNIGPTKADVAKNGGTSLNVSDSGRPVTILVDPGNASIIYNVTAGGGVWKTTNGGTTWTPITESLGSLSMGYMAMDPANSSILYLGLGDAFDGTGIGMVKSSDAGATWGAVQTLGTATSIRSILVHPTNSSIVLASTNAGVFRSTDAGATWSAATGVTVTSCWDLAWAGGSNFVVSSEGSLFRSTDHGATWTTATGLAAGASRISVASAPSNRAILYAMAAKASASPANEDLLDIYKSTDGGATWTGLGAPAKRYTTTNTESSYMKTLLGGQGFYNHMILVSPADPNTAYFGGQLLVAKTTDGGSTFKQMSNWLAQFSLPYIHADFHTGAISADGNTVYAGTDGGIFKSTNAGTTWTDTLNVGITSHLIYSVSSSPASADAVLGGFQDNGTRVRSGSTGTFNQTLGGDGFGTAMHAANASTQLGTLYYARIYKSTDGGANWTSASSGLTESNNSSSAPFITRLAVSPADSTGNTVYTFSNAKVYKSTSFAGSWTALGTSGFPTGLYIRNVAAAKSSGNVVGIVANSGRVFLTANGGSSWTLAGTPANNGSYMSCVAFDPVDYNTVYTASVAPDGTRNHVWKSTNFGVSWTAIDGNGLPSGVPVNVVTVDPGDRNVLYAATHLGLYRSGDGGASWARWGSGLPLVNVTDVWVSPDSSKVRLATFGRGFWELQGAPTAPSITSHPASVSVAAGSTATFTVSAGGTAPLNYQWFRNGASLAGATASSYTTPATVLADSGSTFYATVTNGVGSATSNSATLTVTSAPNDELVLNGGFESGATSWAGTTAAIGTWSQQPANTGTKNAWLCGNGTTSSENLTQAITIPSTVTSATLTFWVHIDTAETTKSRVYDTLKVQVISGTTTTTLATYSNLNKATGYALKTFDLTSYKGKTVTLKFLGAEDSTLQTSFVVDDVSVKIK